MTIQNLRKISIIITLIFLLNVPTIYAQPNTLWTKTFGGKGWEDGKSIRQTADLGFIITGSTSSFGLGNGDVWLLKTDSSGNEVWSQTFGGGKSDYGYSVQQTTDGGYIVTGWTKSFGSGDYDVWLIKTDAGGYKVWSQTFGGSNVDIGYSVQQTSDGGYIITGSTAPFSPGNDDAWLIKTNSIGIEVWSKTFGGSKSDHGESVKQTADGGYVITGTTESFGSGDNDVWLIKTDSSGNKTWSQTFGGSNNDGSHSVQQTTDDGYVITGWTHSFGVGDGDVWLIKTDSNGNKEWSQTFGGNKHDDGWSVWQTADGGYVITGATRSFGAGDWDVWLIKTDASGNKIWSQTFGGSNMEGGNSVQQTADYGYIITGYTNSHSGGSNDDLWLISIAPEATAVKRDSDGLPCRFLLEQNYPNPFNPFTEIEFHIPVLSNTRLEVYNVLGQKLATLVDENRVAGSYKVRFEANRFPSGIYFYKLKAGKFEQVRKMILLE